MAAQDATALGGRQRAERRERADGLLTTGDMARLTGNTLRTVRFYEETGILQPDRRSAGGHRLFGPSQLERLQFISDLRAAGVSLEGIRALLELKLNAESGPEAAQDALVAVRGQLGALDQKIDLLMRLRGELAAAETILLECRSCSDARFPAACDDCSVVRSRKPPVPTSLRVLWSLGDADE